MTDKPLCPHCGKEFDREWDYYIAHWNCGDHDFPHEPETCSKCGGKFKIICFDITPHDFEIERLDS